MGLSQGNPQTCPGLKVSRKEEIAFDVCFHQWEDSRIDPMMRKIPEELGLCGGTAQARMRAEKQNSRIPPHRLAGNFVCPAIGN